MKILEYMGLGKAIVAPRQENIEELVTDGREALLFTSGDAAGFADILSRLVEDTELRRRLGTGALDAVHRRELLWTRNAAPRLRSAPEAARLASMHPTSALRHLAPQTAAAFAFYFYPVTLPGRARD